MNFINIYFKFKNRIELKPIINNYNKINFIKKKFDKLKFFFIYFFIKYKYF